jgi:hypothetical protein
VPSITQHLGGVSFFFRVMISELDFQNQYLAFLDGCVRKAEEVTIVIENDVPDRDTDFDALLCSMARLIIRIEALEGDVFNRIPLEVLSGLRIQFLNLARIVREHQQAHEQHRSHSRPNFVITHPSTGGRPSIEVDLRIAWQLRSERFTWDRIANILGLITII